MRTRFGRLIAVVLGISSGITGFACKPWSVGNRFIMPEQDTIAVRDTQQLPSARIPDFPPPVTVSSPKSATREKLISLDDAIHTALRNSKVVRVLTGIGAASSGSTIYDTAIANTAIDQEAGRFDPVFSFDNAYDRASSAAAALDPLSPFGANIIGGRSDGYNLSTELSKTGFTGAIASVRFTENVARLEPGLFPLNPRNTRTTTMSLTQPLMRGAGRQVNLAPLVIARLNTERTFFQFKDSLQELVRGVIDAYWALVFARTNLWAREQQVEQGQVAFKMADAQFQAGRGTVGERAQARSALASFTANEIAARGDVILREAALRNILGLPPSDGEQLVPSTPPTLKRQDFQWDEVVRLAEENRPDLVELKLLIEIDQQRLTQAQNLARPQVDVQALYRWHGLEGIAPTGAVLGSSPGRFTDLSFALHVELPLGLRRDRASLRQQQLTLAKDVANLEQGLHSAIHQIANTKRFLDQNYEQYLSLREAREAARINLNQQLGIYDGKRAIYLNVLQAITEWGNAVSAEAQTITQYNTELANLERATGTTLETHAIRFYEERFGSISPRGRRADPKYYPESLRPSATDKKFGASDGAAERVFDLRAPVQRPGADNKKDEQP